ncbi:MAG: hypothetical protein C5B60_12240, partial [Chloroflexi bacterium]
MIMPTFDPEHLTPRDSLNRARIVELPGLIPDPDVRSHTGYELLGAQALTEAISAHAAALGLDPACSDASALLPAFDRCLGAEDPAIRATALELGRRFGRSLGYFLLMLRRGDAVNRLARDDWGDTWWGYWSAVRTIWLGGGIVSGLLGSHLRAHAAAVLEEDDGIGSGPTLHLSAFTSALPLIGAARSLPFSATAPSTETAIVLDFGSTSIKRAHAIYSHGALTTLRLLPSLPATQLTTEPPAVTPSDVGPVRRAHWIATQMADMTAATWHVAARPDNSLTPHVVASLASYVRDGRPLRRQGGAYTELSALPPPAAQVLSPLLAERIGHKVEITLLHDGTSAARTYAGTPHAAVLMLGTALGVGYPPPSVGAL